jgi:ubiquinone/menaquinone biosynthesis C-methylase UbiE
MNWLALLVIFMAVVAFLYWLLVTTEGVFLGQRIVILLYDLTAAKYDSIKQYDPEFESGTILHPLLQAMSAKPKPWVLDVATGTARVPLLLLREPRFDGRVVGLDAAAQMLAQAIYKLNQLPLPARQWGSLVQQTADRLPFPDNSFDVVTCLEALEFFPSDVPALEEMFRVLKPGGFLMASRRSGRDARLFLNHYRSTDDFMHLLADLGFASLETYQWQVDYDMVTAEKPDA